MDQDISSIEQGNFFQALLHVLLGNTGNIQSMPMLNLRLKTYHAMLEFNFRRHCS